MILHDYFFHFLTISIYHVSKSKKLYLIHQYFKKDAYARKDQTNICFIWYEEMKADLDAVIDKLNTFLELPPISIENKKALKDFLHIDNFRKNVAVNKTHEMPHKVGNESTSPFIRKGIVGDYKNHFDKKMEQEWDDWLDMEFSGTDINMKCD